MVFAFAFVLIFQTQSCVSAIFLTFCNSASTPRIAGKHCAPRPPVRAFHCPYHVDIDPDKVPDKFPDKDHNEVLDKVLGRTLIRSLI